ncbi:MAG: bifunctional phosphoribosylaminoimidazolecarboxamide formyltransferase/IMP cyclohydrolase [Planctomycetota bacterium]
MTATPIRRALLSVYDKTGIVDLAHDLHARGVELLSTGGTYALLVDSGLPVREVAEYTGFPEMMNGRVKTLHPLIHGGLLCLRDDAQHQAQAEANGIGMIDLVVVNLYPFEATCDDPGSTPADRIEKIDIGGPSMLRSAAKNHAHVCVLSDPRAYGQLREELAANDGGTRLAFRARCARDVFRVTARYDALIAEELSRQAAAAGELDAAERFPDQLAVPLQKVQDLRYGENPHQGAAFYARRLPGCATLAGARQRNGKELSYNNLMDTNGAWELVKEFDAPACAVIKHANPCGCAVAAQQSEAFLRAWAGDPQAAFGSIVAFNREVEEATAAVLCEPGRFVEVIIAPHFAPAAFELLTTKPKWRKNVRLLEAGAITPPPDEARFVKDVLGGLLVQDYDRGGWDPAAIEVVSARAPSQEELRDLGVAWLVVKHLTSNAICLVKDGALVGPGCGQMSRVGASDLAVRLAGPERAAGSALASDAFFPFPDGVAAAAAAGVRAIVQPGGSKGDPAVIAEADKHDIAMVFTGMRHFRH